MENEGKGKADKKKWKGTHFFLMYDGGVIRTRVDSLRNRGVTKYFKLIIIIRRV